MRLAEATKRISYSPVIGACIRRLGLRKVMQWAYANLRGNPTAVRLSMNGVDAIFSVRTPHELRCVDGMWFSETFNEKEMLSGVLSRVRDGDVFLDVGSNLGLFTVFAAKVVGPGGTVVAFEPQTSAHNRLAENIRLNDLQNVKLFKLALSDTRATRKLILGDAGGFSPTAHLADESGPSEVVKTAEYDWLVANESLPIPNVVKMDIEGHEFAALKGMRATLSNPLCTALFCEVHPSALPKDVSREHVIELIQSFGFSSIRMKKRFAEFHIVATRQTTSPAQSHGARVEATA